MFSAGALGCGESLAWPAPDEDTKEAATLGQYTAAIAAQNENAILFPLDQKPGMRFGQAIALDGSTLLIGANGDKQNGVDSGATYLFDHSGAGWVEKAKLVPANLGPGDSFGSSVAISGDALLVGAYMAHEATGTAGSAYFFQRANGQWLEHSEVHASDPEGFALFGNSVAMYGGTAVIGAMQAYQKHGAAYIFSREAGGAWTEQAKLLAGDGTTGAAFGLSVAIDKNRIIVGAGSAPCAQGNYCGAAYIFEYDGMQWTEGAKLTPSDSHAWDFFGRSVAIRDGTALVSTYAKHNDDGTTGAVYVFERQGNVWTETAKIAPPGRKPGDGFGMSVGLQDTRIVAGACMHEINGVPTGQASIFERSGGQWIEYMSLDPSSGQSNEAFGCIVATSPDIIAIGAGKRDTPSEDSGAVYVFAAPPGVADGFPCTAGGECASGVCCSNGDMGGTCCTNTTSGGSSGGPCDPTVTANCVETGSVPGKNYTPLHEHETPSLESGCSTASEIGRSPARGGSSNSAWVVFLFAAALRFYRFRWQTRTWYRPLRARAQRGGYRK